MRRSFVLLLGLLVFALTGCDSSSPIDPPSPQDVEGVYHIAELRFVPQASAIEPANVLSRIDVGRSNLELSGLGDAIFRFALTNQPSALLAGDFSVTATQLRLRLTDPQSRLPTILLSSPLTLNRADDAELVLQQVQTVNLAAFDPERYAGLTAVQGTLTLRFRLGPAPTR